MSLEEKCIKKEIEEACGRVRDQLEEIAEIAWKKVIQGIDEGGIGLRDLA